ncbi:hypothetical protein BH11MYX4_BH11MYX4_65060 [soil metagenome]
MKRLLAAVIRPELALALLTLGAAGGAYLAVTSRGGQTVDIGAVKTTVGDLRSLHAEVRVRGREVRGSARLRDGDDVKTAPGGRARIRLDDGTVVVVDGSTEITLRGARVALTKGRLFVQAGAASRTEVAIRDSVATVVSAAAAFDADEGARGAPKVYCAWGELVLALAPPGKSVHVPSGETATLAQGGAKVAPETAFDDWTGGLAVPWSGERAPASAIAELWGGSGPADPGAPLVVRSEKVDVTIEGELSITRTRTTYFNGSDRDVQADVRIALPEGAVVSRVARAEEGAAVESVAALGTGNRGGGVSSSASRLEWAGGGWLRGTLSSIRAGSSFDLLVDYVEWLPEKDGRATYRFPMASENEAPMVGGLELRVSSQSPAQWLSASTGAAVVNGGIELRRADVRPTGDLVVEMVPGVVHAGKARAYVERGELNEDPYVVVRTEAPELSETGVTLALVVDVSSSVGPALLET